jgi:hypothetical protein
LGEEDGLFWTVVKNRKMYMKFWIVFCSSGYPEDLIWQKLMDKKIAAAFLC